MSRLARVVACLQLGFAVLVFLGSTSEVLNLLFPTLVPEIQDLPLMRLHHTERVVYYWTIASNVVTAVLAALLFRGALGTFHGRVEASRSSRIVIRVFGCVVVGASIVSAVYLVPPIWSMLGDESQKAMGGILLVSVVSALGGLGVVLASLYAGHGRIARQGRSAVA